MTIGWYRDNPNADVVLSWLRYPGIDGATDPGEAHDGSWAPWTGPLPPMSDGFEAFVSARVRAFREGA